MTTAAQLNRILAYNWQRIEPETGPMHFLGFGEGSDLWYIEPGDAGIWHCTHFTGVDIRYGSGPTPEAAALESREALQKEEEIRQKRTTRAARRYANPNTRAYQLMWASKMTRYKAKADARAALALARTFPRPALP